MKKFSLYNIVKILYFGTIVLVGVYNVAIGNMTAGLYSAGAALMGFIPWVVERFTKHYLEDVVKGAYLVFVFCSTFLGSAFRMYDVFSWWDIALHVASGVLLGLGALYIYNYIIKLSKQQFVFNTIIILLFCLAVPALFGCIWEMIEFGSDEILGMNTQIRESGVRDTMEDIISNTSGSIIALLIIVLGSKKGRPFHPLISRLTREIKAIKTSK